MWCSILECTCLWCHVSEEILHGVMSYCLCDVPFWTEYANVVSCLGRQYVYVVSCLRMSMFMLCLRMYIFIRCPVWFTVLWGKCLCGVVLEGMFMWCTV
jgi:hypothetical protein